MASVAGRSRLLPFLLLLFLLLLVGAARGNEGGAVGSCLCEKHAEPPRLLTDFSRKLQSCDTCKPFIRFNFPSRKVCGLSQVPWVINYSSSLCPQGGQEGVRGADASRGRYLPAPTSRSTAASQTSPWPAGVSPDRSLETPRTAVAWGPEKAGSSPPPSVEAAARGASRTPVEPEREDSPPAPALDTKVPVLALLGLTLVLVSVMVFVVCRRRRGQRSRSWPDEAPQLPLREQEEERLCLPGEKT